MRWRIWVAAGLAAGPVLMASACSSGRARPAAVASPIVLTCTPHAPLRPTGPSKGATLVVGAPEAATICRYGQPRTGPASGGIVLTATAHLDALQAQRLAREMDAGPQVGSGAYNCPADTGSEAAVHFAVAGSDELVLVHLSGCRFEASSTAVRWTPAAVSTTIDPALPT